LEPINSGHDPDKNLKRAKFRYLKNVYKILNKLLGSGWWGRKKGGICILYEWNIDPIDCIFR
jgi:hypothetical protein